MERSLALSFLFLAGLEAEKDNPQADTSYYSGAIGYEAAKKGLHQSYKPKGWEKIPARLEGQRRPLVDRSHRNHRVPSQYEGFGRGPGAPVVEGPVEAGNADGNGYKMKHVDGGPVEVVIPAEGTFTMPLVMGLVKGAPRQAEAKKYLDWLLTPPAQAEFAKGFFRPVIPGTMPADLKSKFLPEREYSRARPLDLAKMAAASDALKKAWMEEIRGSGR